MEDKNINAIDKIIGELSFRDYQAQWNKLTDKQKHNVHIGKRQFSYVLSAATLEALEIKQDYISGEITEETYKSYCLQYNMRTMKV